MAIDWPTIERSRARLARERGAIVQDWGGRFPVALVYPNRYYVGMSSLGFQLVYRLFNSMPGFLAERAFYDGPGQILSIESQRPLNDFAVVAFSVSFELDYFNLVATLRQAGIPLMASDRDEQHPLIAGGGPCFASNPEPVAPLFDFIAVGEAEAILPPVCEALLEHRDSEREEMLGALERLPGVYVPLSHRPGADLPVRRQWVKDLDLWPAASVIQTRDTELGEMLLLETARGCGRGCRFCLAGFCFRPFRPRSLSRLLDEIDTAENRSGRVGLVGAAVSDYPDIDPLVAELRARRLRISVSSLRADSLSEGLLRGLAESGARTITLAPEAGSEKLRTRINKCLTEEALFQAVERVGHWRFPQLKLYFMVGLPGETEEDLMAIPVLTRELRRVLDSTGTSTRLAANLGPFVPKAHTPFETQPLLPLAEVKERLSRVRRELRSQKVETPVESAEWAEVQAVLARGDRRLASVLAQARANSLAEWRRLVGEQGITGHEWEEAAAKGEPLPWEVVDTGVGKAYLRREAQKAIAGQTTGQCPPDGCARCAVCPPAGI